jgi:2-phosphosulfolactate phosphatase
MAAQARGSSARSDTRGRSVDLAWGVSGTKHLAADCDVLVVVDVLSFSTSVSVAVERGALVWPFEFGTDGAVQLAREVGAELARGRSVSQGPTLSPASLLDLEPGSRLVLPSPNGSTVSRAAIHTGLPVLTGCLRSASATARWLRRHRRVGIVAAGEQWVDGSLRPAYEDLLGSGAIAKALARAGYRASPDAAAAVAATARPRPLVECMSGVELVERGFEDDVKIAEERDATDVVSVMQAGRFVGEPTPT